MATVTLAGNTFNTTAGVKTVVATPAVGDLIVVIVAATGVASGLGVTDNNPTGTGTYVQVVSCVKNTSADQMAAFVRAQPVQSATSTTWTTSGDSASTGGGLFVYRISGLSLAALQAIRGSGKQDNQAGSTAPAPVLTQAALTGNPCITAQFNGTNTGGVTAPTSWTRDADVGYNTPATGADVCHINSGFTSSTVTWGSATTVYCSLALELSTAQGQTSLQPPRGSAAVDDFNHGTPLLQGVARAAFY